MSKQQSVAPKERVNITYKPATGDGKEEVELPLKILMLGEFTGREDATPIEERKPINVDKDNFNEVMSKQHLELSFNVPDRLSKEEGAQLPVKLSFESLADYEPEAIVNQVDDLRKLLELRAALHTLKGPLGNIPSFKKKLQTLLGNDEGRQRLMAELGIEDTGDDAGS